MKPTIVLIHGAWHTPGHFSSLIHRLESAGYTVRAPQLPSSSDIDTPAIVDCKPDIETIQAILSDEADNRGNDIVVVSHSYGGIPATDSCKSFLKKEREQRGKKGGVVGLCYLCAWVLVPGESLLTTHGLPDDAFDSLAQVS